MCNTLQDMSAAVKHVCLVHVHIEKQQKSGPRQTRRAC